LVSAELDALAADTHAGHARSAMSRIIIAMPTAGQADRDRSQSPRDEHQPARDTQHVLQTV
jgi:hypothetical protein